MLKLEYWIVEEIKMAKNKPKKENHETVMIPVSNGARKKLIQMKLDLVDGGTYEELMQRFIESEGY